MRRINLFIATLLITLSAVPAYAGSFTALAAPYPPYSVSQGLTVKGMSVSALTTIMEMCGTPMDDRSIKLTPWAYAYEATARKSRSIIVNAMRTPKTEHLYKWVGPILTSKIVLISRKADNHFIPFESDLRDYRIATVRWSRPEKALLAGGFSVLDVERTPTHVKSLRMLARGEVDLFATTELGAPYLLKGLGMNPDDYAISFVYEEEPLYFAFSRDTDDRLIARLNRALQTIKTTGEGGLSQFDRMISTFPVTMK